MIRYRYTTSCNPPAPFVKVRIRDPHTGSEIVDFPAQLDTAADRSVLPSSVIETLDLGADSQLYFQGFGSEIIELPIYLVGIGIHDLPPILTHAVLGENEPYVLLGRDILNSYRITFDGPQLILDIG
jgi:hypothetical protein